MQTRLHQYANYDEYRDRQVFANKVKLDRVWAKAESIAAISAYLLANLDPLRRGICHGARRGDEMQWFRSALDCDVIGTEISDTAMEFPNTIQHDFHEIKPEWVAAFDFVYSNSFDHAFDPCRALHAWMGSLRIGGLCIIEHSVHHGPDYVNRNDPFGATIEAMPGLIQGWGPFHVKAILELPDIERQSKALVIEISN